MLQAAYQTKNKIATQSSRLDSSNIKVKTFLGDPSEKDYATLHQFFSIRAMVSEHRIYGNNMLSSKYLYMYLPKLSKIEIVALLHFLFISIKRSIYITLLTHSIREYTITYTR